MKVRIEATQDELVNKRVQAVEQFADRLGVRLEKAAKHLHDDPELEYPAMQSLHEKTTKVYKAMVKKMLAEINTVIDSGSVVKSDAQFEKLKTVLLQQGRSVVDFEKGGALYGQGIQELSKLVRQ